jgi:sortase A
VRVPVIMILASLLVGVPADSASAQFSRAFSRKGAACRCTPQSKSRRPRFLLPVAGGIGFLPVSLAARDSMPAALDFPTVVDIRDPASPPNAIEGERALAVGALAPDTATSLPTFMAVATILALAGVYLTMPRRRRRRARVWLSRGARHHGHWRLRTVHRRRIGIAVTTGGGLLLLLGSREYAEGAQAQRRARAEWLKVSASASVDSASAAATKHADVATPAPVAETRRTPDVSAVPLPQLSRSDFRFVRGGPVARLLIPSIDLDQIVVEGVGPIELNAGPGHYPGSALPGETGNAIISAHRDRHFRRMGEIEVGTTIRTETRTGVTEWVVTERRIVSRDAPALFQESEATLTLTTCWPIRYFGPAPDRLLLIAKRAA